MNNPITRGLGLAALCAATLMPLAAHASVESSLMGLKTTLLSGILPILAVMALGFAAFQFFTGNINAKQYLIYAVVGSVILFGAQSIVDLLSRVVR
jgi:type IV secretory pathway VirB2 component (pilin)